MLGIEEAISKINQDKNDSEQKLSETKNRSKEIEILLDFFTKSFTEFIKQLSGGKYEIKNLPKVQQVEGTVLVRGLTSLIQAIEELKYLTKKNKVEFPDTQKIEGTVKVSNPTPETKIPPYPKEIKSEITSLPKYVGDKLDKISEDVKKIELSPVINVQKDTPKVEIDLKGVMDRLEAITERLNLLEINPTVVIDTDELKKSTDDVKQAINNLKFPVPNFQSSWSHSLSMRSEDMDKAFAYTTDGTKKVIESITVRDEDGALYKKTYTYAGDSSGDPLTESKWTRV